MELRRYLAMLRRRVLLILLTVVVAVGFTIATADTTARYTAQSTLYIGANTFANTPSFDPNLSGDQQAGLQRVISTFAVMIKSGPIASAAIENTGAPRSAAAVVAETFAFPVKDTNILVIAVADTDPAVAQTLSIGIAEAF